MKQTSELESEISGRVFKKAKLELAEAWLESACKPSCLGVKYLRILFLLIFFIVFFYSNVPFLRLCLTRLLTILLTQTFYCDSTFRYFGDLVYKKG